MRQIFFTTEVVTHRAEVPGGVSERGIDLPSTYTETPVEATVEPGRPDLSADGSGRRVIEGCTLYFVPAHAYGPDDQFVVRGRTFRVAGGPELSWGHEDAWLDAGNVAYLDRVTG